MTFPDFMFRNQNKIPSSQQNTPDIEGYYYTADDGSQMAFWTYKADRVSKEHRHDYDEWMLCVEGEYLVTVDGVTVYHAGDTSMIEQMKNLQSRHIDYAMYPIDGIFNMDAVEATEVANLVGAKKNIPIHDYNIKDQPKKEEKFTPEGRMLLEYGQTIKLKPQR